MKLISLISLTFNKRNTTVLEGRICEMLPEQRIRDSILGNLDNLDRKTLQRIVKVMDPYYGERMDVCLGDS